MKKLKSILLILAVCLSLCSCAELDEMKSIHALDYGDGILKFNNQTYKLFDYETDGLDDMELDDFDEDEEMPF